MIVRELVEALKEYPSELPVLFSEDDDELVVKINKDGGHYMPYQNKNADLQALAMYEHESHLSS